MLSAGCLLIAQTPGLAQTSTATPAADSNFLAEAKLVNHWLKPSDYMPVSEIKPGMEGYGLSVFQGTKPERFNIKVIGVVKKVLNGRDAIMVHLSGPQIGKNNVIRGMSGSPVYINGKLIGAVSYGFDFSIEPIAGITPIADMLDALAPQEGALEPTRISKLTPTALPANVIQTIETAEGSAAVKVMGGAPHMVPLMAPVSLAGFSPRAEQFLTENMKDQGMWVSSGAGGAMDGSLAPGKGTMQPGGAISVMLSTGDFNTSACGTATAIFGNHVLAFGHPFMSAGSVDFPMATAYIHQVLPNLSVSFKVASPLQVIGAFESDRPWAVSGQIGRSAKMIPVTYTVTDETRHVKRTFHCNVVDHPDLTPELVAATAMSAIDSTHQSSGPYVLKVKSNIEAAGIGTIERQDRYGSNFTAHAGDLRRLHLGVGDPVAGFLMGTTAKIIDNEFEKASIKSVNVDISLEDGHNTAQIERVYLDKSFVAPGESFDVHCVLRPYNQKPVTKTLTLKVPRDVPDGNLLVGVSSGDDIDIVRRRMGLVDPTPENLDQVVKKIRDAGSGDNLTAVLALPEQSISIGGTILPNPPAHWAKLFFSDKYTRGPALVRAEERVSSPQNTLIDGNHIITIEVRRPDKATAKSTPYLPSAAGSFSSGEGTYITDAARKTMESYHHSDKEGATASGSNDKQGTSTYWTSSKEYPHMRSLLVWSQETYNDFSNGKTDSSTVDSWGRISPALKDLSQKPIDSDMRIWSSAWANGYFWFATNDKVYRWKGDDSAPEAVAHIKGVCLPAMTVDSAGNVYVASVPGGQIYRIDTGKGIEDAAQPLVKLSEPIITSLCTGDADRLYAGVAGTGKVYEIAPAKPGEQRQAKTLFDSGQASVTSLSYCPSDKRLYVGTAEKGAVFSIDKDGESRAEYQSADHIITGAVRDSKGDLYVATAGPGQLLKIAPTGAINTLATSEAFYTLYYDRATDGVYSGDGEGDITHAQVDPLSHESYFVPVCHTEQEAVLALAGDGNGRLFAGTSNLPIARTFDMKPSNNATYTSIVKDGGRQTHWARLRAYGAYNEVNDTLSKALTIETRSGETSTPDATWTSWKPARYESESYVIVSPEARYLQYRLVWKQHDVTAPTRPVSVGKVEVTYQPTNLPPEFGTISLKTGTACSGKQDVTVNATDPDGDNLAMAIEVSSDGAKTWTAVASDLRSHHSSTSKESSAEKSVSEKKESSADSDEKKESKDDGASVKETETAPGDSFSSSRSESTSSPKFQPLDAKDDEKPEEGDKAKDKDGADKDKDNDGADKDNKEAKKDEQKGESEKSEKTAEEKAAEPKAAVKSKSKAKAAAALASHAKPESSGGAEKFSYNWDTSKLKDGNYVVKFVINDQPSNPNGHLQTVALRTVEVENSPPKIVTLELHQDKSKHSVLTVRAHDVHTPIVNATYRFDDGEPFALGNPDNITDGLDAEFEVSDITVPHGSHKLEVQVTNKAGNTATKTITL
jgi:sugar lactone lactonase YvrE